MHVCVKRMTRNLVESMQRIFNSDYFRQDSKSSIATKKVNKNKYNKTRSSNIDQNQ